MAVSKRDPQRQHKQRREARERELDDLRFKLEKAAMIRATKGVEVEKAKGGGGKDGGTYTVTEYPELNQLLKMLQARDTERSKIEAMKLQAELERDRLRAAKGDVAADNGDMKAGSLEALQARRAHQAGVRAHLEALLDEVETADLTPAAEDAGADGLVEMTIGEEADDEGTCGHDPPGAAGSAVADRAIARAATSETGLGREAVVEGGSGGAGPGLDRDGAAGADVAGPGGGDVDDAGGARLWQDARRE